MKITSSTTYKAGYGSTAASSSTAKAKTQKTSSSTAASSKSKTTKKTTTKTATKTTTKAKTTKASTTPASSSKAKTTAKTSTAPASSSKAKTTSTASTAPVTNTKVQAKTSAGSTAPITATQPYTPDADPQLDGEVNLDDLDKLLDDNTDDAAEKGAENGLLGTIKQGIQNLIDGITSTFTGSKAEKTSGSSKSSDKKVSDKEKIEELKKLISEQESRITSIIYTANNELQQQQEAIEQLLKQSGLSDENYQAYKQQEEVLSFNISTLEDAITLKDSTIIDLETTKKSNEEYIKLLEKQLKENKKNSSSDTKAKNQNLETKIEQLKVDNIALDEKITKAQNEKNALLTEKQGYESNKSNLIKGLLNNCNPEVLADLTAAVQEYENSVSTIKAQRDTEVAQIQASMATSKAEVKNLEAKSDRNKFIQKNSANTMKSVIDFGKSLDGLNATQMKKLMNKDGYAFYHKAWCGQFQSYIINKTIGLKNTAKWYQNCNRASCTAMLTAAKKAGAVVKSSEAKPGDLLLLTKNNSKTKSYHVAMITSINADGSFNTIEGNTSDDNGKYTTGVVNTRRRKANSGIVVRVTP